MDSYGALGSDLVFFALSLGLMQFLLWRRPGGGIFAALPAGLLPALVVAGVEFLTLQHPELPAVQKERAEWAATAKDMALKELPDKDKAADREAFQEVYERLLEAKPAGEFCVFMALMAPLAVLLRKRQARLGRSPDPGSLGKWSVKWGWVWLVLGPGFLLGAGHTGWIDLPDWEEHLALNLLTVGTALFLFQGFVVFGAKVVAWLRDPRTRFLAAAGLAGMAAALVFVDPLGLLQVFVLMMFMTGLLEPWVDLRHLKAPVRKGDAA
jgi:hypothetical protein